MTLFTFAYAEPLYFDSPTKQFCLVTSTYPTLTNNETNFITFMEDNIIYNFNYTELIDDSFTNFSLYISNGLCDFFVISDSVNGGTLAFKLNSSTLGIIAYDNIGEYLGICNDDITGAGTSTTVVNNTHIMSNWTTTGSKSITSISKTQNKCNNPPSTEYAINISTDSEDWKIWGFKYNTLGYNGTITSNRVEYVSQVSSFDYWLQWNQNMSIYASCWVAGCGFVTGSTVTTTTTTTTSTTTTIPFVAPSCTIETKIVANAKYDYQAWGSPGQYNDSDYDTFSYTGQQFDFILLNFSTNASNNQSYKIKLACGEDTPNYYAPSLYCFNGASYITLYTFSCLDTTPLTVEGYIPQACWQYGQINISVNNPSAPDDNSTKIFESEIHDYTFDYTNETCVNATSTTVTTTTTTTTTLASDTAELVNDITEEIKMLAFVLLFLGLWTLGYYITITKNRLLGSVLIVATIPLDFYFSVAITETYATGSGFLGWFFIILIPITLLAPFFIKS